MTGVGTKLACMLWAWASVCSCAAAAQPSQKPAAPVAPVADIAPVADDARAVVDFAGVDAWLECTRHSSDLPACENQSAATTGGRIAALSIPSFGSEKPAEVTPRREAVEALVLRMKAWPDALSRAARFLPTRIGGGPLDVFVVANGHPWGDAYVRGVERDGENVRLSPTGEPVIVLNAVLIASGYRGNAAEQAESAFGVLSHELFHAVFRRYREKERAWTRFSRQLSPQEELELLVLDEGVAHFVDREQTLVREGFPPGRAEAALASLAEAWQRLEGMAAGSTAAEAILQSANQGRYWDKYGSISGMLLAYGIFRAAGVEGIKQALRCGPGRFLALYAAARVRLADLPKLPDRLSDSRFIDLCQQKA